MSDDETRETRSLAEVIEDVAALRRKANEERARRARALQRAEGLTVRQLAKRMGVSTGTAQKLLSDDDSPHDT